MTRVGPSSKVRAIIAVAVASFALCCLAACGTKSVANVVTVSVDRGTGAVPAGPLRVAVFDTTMGQSSDYAQESAGITTETQPYRTEVNVTVTKMIFDGSPAERLDLGLYLPAVAPKGYFAVSVVPGAGGTQTVKAPFVGDYDYSAETDGAVQPLPVVITATADGDAWQVALDAKPL